MSQTQLILEITANKQSAFEWNGSELTNLSSVVCATKTETGYKQSLVGLLESLGNLDRFENYSCSYFSQDFTLVPTSLFASSSSETLLQFTVDKVISKGEVDYNRLPEWNSVIIYELPLWIKSALIIKIPRVVIQHEIAHVLRQLNTGSTIPTRAHLIIHENHFSFVLRKDGVIAHASVQEYQSSEDLLYHILITVQRLELTQKSEFNIHTTSPEGALLVEKCIEQSKNIEALAIHQFKTSNNQHLQFQTLCV